MTDTISNDNAEIVSASAAPEPDAYGQAALFLVESLMHVLIERSVISAADAVDAVETATDVKQDLGLYLGDTPATLAKSLHLLEMIGESIRRDLPALKIRN